MPGSRKFFCGYSENCVPRKRISTLRYPAGPPANDTAARPERVLPGHWRISGTAAEDVAPELHHGEGPFRGGDVLDLAALVADLPAGRVEPRIEQRVRDGARHLVTLGDAHPGQRVAQGRAAGGSGVGLIGKVGVGDAGVGTDRAVVRAPLRAKARRGVTGGGRNDDLDIDRGARAEVTGCRDG